MALYQKYRPASFEEMCGNKEQIDALKNTLQKENRPHVYLLVGPAGCGKTTAARIAAKELGANDLSIREINSANNRGIETARQIIDQMRFMPAGGSTLVYIIDELHMTTKEWQNAMLKPLEDTPVHVFFFLCTTNPEKLIAPLKSRCFEVKFNPLDEKQMYILLRKVCRAESFEISKDVLQLICENCEGSPRKALVLLEKVASLSSEDEQRMVVRTGILDEDDADVIELCRELLKKGTTWRTVADIIKRMNIDDLERIRHIVLGYMSSVLLGGSNMKAALAIEFFSEPFYDSGKAGFVYACFSVVTS